MLPLSRSLFRAAAALIILLALGGLPPMPASASSSSTTELTFHLVADSYVDQSSADTNYGTATELHIQSNPTVLSYLRVGVAGLNGFEVAQARLRVYVISGSTYGLHARPVTNDSWSETGITYANAPAFRSTPYFSTLPRTGTWVTMDVSRYVRSAGMFSFALTSPSGTTIRLASREAGPYAPQLLITLGSWQPSFPIRAAFYYPWFPQAWRQSGIYPYTNYNPKLGFYSSNDSTTLQRHLTMMNYARIQVGIASWWGQGSQTDTKVAGLLNAAAGTHYRWSLYYENESQGDPSVSQIHNDLLYIRDHYGKDPSFLRVKGRFVVFVYSAGNDACGMADRWKRANNTVGAFVVLKVFQGFRDCASQPNSWHQYAPAFATSQQDHYSYSISPGFWQVGTSVRLGRNVTRWQQNVRDMVASGANWQLITTFSEWGEGTAVEPATQWRSASGYGQYLDALHYNGRMP